MLVSFCCVKIIPKVLWFKTTALYQIYDSACPKFGLNSAGQFSGIMLARECICEPFQVSWGLASLVWVQPGQFYVFHVISHLLAGYLGLFTWQPGRIISERVWEVWKWVTVTSATLFWPEASHQVCPESKGEEKPPCFTGRITCAISTGSRGELQPFLLSATHGHDLEFAKTIKFIHCMLPLGIFELWGNKWHQTVYVHCKIVEQLGGEDVSALQMRRRFEVGNNSMMPKFQEEFTRGSGQKETLDPHIQSLQATPAWMLFKFPCF